MWYVPISEEHYVVVFVKNICMNELSVMLIFSNHPEVFRMRFRQSWGCVAYSYGMCVRCNLFVFHEVNAICIS